jgi:hypothetical protein
MKGYLTSYKEEKYHIPDFQRAGRENGIEERFNYVHSSLRSAIEQTFWLCGRIGGEFKCKCHLMILKTKCSL